MNRRFGFCVFDELYTKERVKMRTNQKKISLAVIRAVSRLNNHTHQRNPRPIVLHKKLIAKYLSTLSR